jgi:hypothetical protein
MVSIDEETAAFAMLMENRGKQWLDELGLQHIWMDTKGKVGGQLSQPDADGV